jgi:hypothetical protein
MTVFALFFGLSLLDALERRNWMRACLWLVVALCFLLAGWRPRHHVTPDTSTPSERVQ